MDEPTVTPDVATAIGASRSAFIGALKRGDVEAAAAYYTVDARLLAPSAETLIGPGAIARFWQAGIEAGVEGLELACERVELEPRGGIAYEIGRYALRLRPPHGAIVVDRGRYLLVHRLEADGVWRRAVETFSPEGGPREVTLEPLGGAVSAAPLEGGA